jgi:hypothetical protein
MKLSKSKAARKLSTCTRSRIFQIVSFTGVPACTGSIDRRSGCRIQSIKDSNYERQLVPDHETYMLTRSLHDAAVDLDDVLIRHARLQESLHHS